MRRSGDKKRPSVPSSSAQPEHAPGMLTIYRTGAFLRGSRKGSALPLPALSAHPDGAAIAKGAR
jgi:hypothetical protein